MTYTIRTLLFLLLLAHELAGVVVLLRVDC